MELLQDTVALRASTEQLKSLNTLAHFLGALGSTTPSIGHRIALGAVGSGPPAIHCHTAYQW